MTETTETTLLLTWKVPLAKIDLYRLVFVSADGHKAEVEVPGDANTHVLRNLKPGMVYTITLTSERGRKKSAPATISASTGQFDSSSSRMDSPYVHYKIYFVLSKCDAFI